MPQLQSIRKTLFSLVQQHNSMLLIMPLKLALFDAWPASERESDLVLLARNSDEEGEALFSSAIREASEETAINDLAFHWGHEFRETIPYGNAKVARHYLAETKQSNLVLPVSPSLGKPEHEEYRWVSFKPALKMLPPRVIPILEWAGRQLAETETRGEYAGQF